MNPATVFAEWTLGRVPGEKLALIASALLADGVETPTLRVLAASHSRGLDGKDAALFVAAMDELGIEQPSCEAAALLVARRVARQLLSGELKPRDACADIASLTLACGDRVDSLTDFFYLLEEWELAAELGPADLRAAEADIREAATHLLTVDQLSELSPSGGLIRDS